MRRRLLAALVILLGIVQPTSAQQRLPFWLWEQPDPRQAPADAVWYSETNLRISTTGTAEEVLKTVTIPAGVFTSGLWDGFEVFATLQAAANTNQKTVRLRIGGIAGDVICATANDANSAQRWQFQGRAMQDQPGLFNFQATNSRVSGTTFTFGSFTSANDLASNPTFVTVTATTATAAGDVTLTSMRVVLLRKRP